MRARRAAFAVACACVVLPACGSPAASSTAATDPASASASPLAGTPVTTAKFSTVVPAGWTNKLDDSAEVQKFSGNGEVEFLVEQGPPGQLQPGINDVTGNINVLLLATPVPDDQVAAYLQIVSTTGATNLSSPQSFTIDGATGELITYDRDIQGTSGESQDMIVNHGGDTFDIVLTTSQFAFTEQQPGLQAVLADWRWTS
jgi:hypothetical protein